MNDNLHAAIELLSEEVLHISPDRLIKQFGQPLHPLDPMALTMHYEKLNQARKHFEHEASGFLAAIERSFVERRSAVLYDFYVKDGQLIAWIGSKRIHGWNPTDTFILSLYEFGIERVAELGLKSRGALLVSDVPQKQRNGYPTIREKDGWYVVVHSDTQGKAKMLTRIAKMLSKQLNSSSH